MPRRGADRSVLARRGSLGVASRWPVVAWLVKAVIAWRGSARQGWAGQGTAGLSRRREAGLGKAWLRLAGQSWRGAEQRGIVRPGRARQPARGSGRHRVAGPGIARQGGLGLAGPGEDRLGAARYRGAVWARLGKARPGSARRRVARQPSLVLAWSVLPGRAWRGGNGRARLVRARLGSAGQSGRVVACRGSARRIQARPSRPGLARIGLAVCSLARHGGQGRSWRGWRSLARFVMAVQARRGPDGHG